MRRFRIEVPFTCWELPSEENPKPYQDPDGQTGTFTIELDAKTPEKAIEEANVWLNALEYRIR
jgi:hypothetical protein